MKILVNKLLNSKRGKPLCSNNHSILALLVLSVNQIMFEFMIF